MPVYNGEQFLAETIQTCLDQTYKNWELLIIDDGSTDSTKAVVHSFEDVRIKYHFKENGGQASARNHGVSLSKGNWIAFLDADDLWTQDKLEKQINLITEEEAVNVVFTRGVIFSKTTQNDYPHGSLGLLKGPEWFKELYQQSEIINSSVLIQKTVAQNHPLDESPIVKGSEDWELWLKLCKAGCVFYGMKERLVKYRDHDVGIHQNKIQMFKGKLHVYDKYQNGLLVQRQLKLKQYRYAHRELMNQLFIESEHEEIYEVFKSLRAKDKYGLATNLQKLAILLKTRHFHFLSTKIIYRIAYRLEHLIYKLAL